MHCLLETTILIDFVPRYSNKFNKECLKNYFINENSAAFNIRKLMFSERYELSVFVANSILGFN